jgi:hypothetical protein
MREAAREKLMSEAAAANGCGWGNVMFFMGSGRPRAEVF